MKTYTIKRCEGRVNWDAVDSLSVACVLWEEDCGIRMEQKICYDENAIYVNQRAYEQSIRAELTQPLSRVCEDSCMEFFFGFTEDGRYVNFECNPNGCIYVGFGGNREDRVRVIVEYEDAVFAVHPSREVDGWSLTYRIPLSFLRNFYPGLTLEPGRTLRANCYKCGDKTEKPHFLSWNAVTSEMPDFHRPCDFGCMILGE